MAKIVTLHESDALTLPLAGGAALRATPFRETARVALVPLGALVLVPLIVETHPRRAV